MIENGYVAAVKQLSEDSFMAGEKAPPMMEELQFVLQDLTWTYEIGGATRVCRCDKTRGICSTACACDPDCEF